MSSPSELTLCSDRCGAPQEKRGGELLRLCLTHSVLLMNRWRLWKREQTDGEREQMSLSEEVEQTMLGGKAK